MDTSTEKQFSGQQQDILLPCSYILLPCSFLCEAEPSPIQVTHLIQNSSTWDQLSHCASCSRTTSTCAYHLPSEVTQYTTPTDKLMKLWTWCCWLQRKYSSSNFFSNNLGADLLLSTECIDTGCLEETRMIPEVRAIQ